MMKRFDMRAVMIFTILFLPMASLAKEGGAGGNPSNHVKAADGSIQLADRYFDRSFEIYDEIEPEVLKEIQNLEKLSKEFKITLGTSDFWKEQFYEKFQGNCTVEFRIVDQLTEEILVNLREGSPVQERWATGYTQKASRSCITELKREQFALTENDPLLRALTLVHERIIGSTDKDFPYEYITDIVTGLEDLRRVSTKERSWDLEVYQNVRRAIYASSVLSDVSPVNRLDRIAQYQVLEDQGVILLGKTLKTEQVTVQSRGSDLGFLFVDDIEMDGENNRLDIQVMADSSNEFSWWSRTPSLSVVMSGIENKAQLVVALQSNIQLDISGSHNTVELDNKTDMNRKTDLAYGKLRIKGDYNTVRRCPACKLQIEGESNLIENGRASPRLDVMKPQEMALIDGSQNRIHNSFLNGVLRGDKNLLLGRSNVNLLIGSGNQMTRSKGETLRGSGIRLSSVRGFETVEGSEITLSEIYGAGVSQFHVSGNNIQLKNIQLPDPQGSGEYHHVIGNGHSLENWNSDSGELLQLEANSSMK